MICQKAYSITVAGAVTCISEQGTITTPLSASDLAASSDSAERLCVTRSSHAYFYNTSTNLLIIDDTVTGLSSGSYVTYAPSNQSFWMMFTSGGTKLTGYTKEGVFIANTTLFDGNDACEVAYEYTSGKIIITTFNGGSGNPRRLYLIDPTDGTFTTQNVGTGDGANGADIFTSPGKVYVNATGPTGGSTGIFYAFETSGFTELWSLDLTGLWTFGRRAFAYHPTDGNIFFGVVNAGVAEILVVDSATGTITDTWNIGAGFTPRSMVFDPIQGRLIVADTTTDVIKVFEYPSGTLVCSTSVLISTNIVEQPTSGKIYVGNSTTIHIYT